MDCAEFERQIPIDLPKVRIHLKSVLIIASILSSATVVLSAESWMNATEMRDAFAGRTLVGAYASGMTFTERYAPDGSIVYSDPRGDATGQWHISQQGFCTFYDTDTMNGGCFLARQTGANCFEFYIIEGQDTGPLPREKGTPYVAQGWYPDKPSTCTALTT